jgi:hypothetical protein
MKTMTCPALASLALVFSLTFSLAFSLSSSLASAQPAQSSDWPYATQQSPRVRPAPQLTQPEGPVVSWDPLRFQVGLESRTTWLFDDGAKRLAGKRAPAGGGLSVQADILRPSDKVAARLDLGWVTTSNSTYQDTTNLEERLETNVIALGVSARYSLLRWLAPYARLAGGIGWDKVTVGNGSTSLHDRQLFGQGSAGAGLSLRTPGLRFWQSPTAPLVGAAGQIEGGYALASGSDFSLQSAPAGSAATPIPTNSVAIGHVGRSAPYLRITLGITF